MATIMENTIYIAAVIAALGGAGLAYYLIRRGTAAQTAPAPGSPFSRYGERIRLRDLFRLAVMLEEKGEELYLRLAKKAARPETKNLCEWLAEQEVTHREFAQGRLARWRTLAPHLTEWPAFLEKVKQEGFFENAPGNDADEDELAAFAIRQEVKSAEFYASFENSFPEAWKRDNLLKLVEEERSHERMLRENYPHIK